MSARTPRREAGNASAVVTASGGHARERALQDPGLKDYVCWDELLGPICLPHPFAVWSALDVMLHHPQHELERKRGEECC